MDRTSLKDPKTRSADAISLEIGDTVKLDRRLEGTMSARLFTATLLSTALLSSCSSLPADVRPEVAQPLDEARILANGGADKAAITAKLSQAASVPNLNGDERDQIRSTGEYALARAGFGGGIPGSQPGAPAREMTPANSLNRSGPLR